MIEKGWMEPYLDRMEEASRYFIRQVQERIVAEGGMSPSQFCLLKILEADPDSTVTDIAGRLRMTVAGATGLIDRLVRAGIVVRSRDESDRRVVHTSLSVTGRRLFVEEGQRRRSIMAGCMEPLAPEEIGLFVTLLEKLTRVTADSGRIKE